MNIWGAYNAISTRWQAVMTVDEIVAGGEAYLQHLVDTSAQESLTLEFKGGRQFKDGGLDQRAKEQLAASLSSLSNSAGGLLIIGVDCRKGADKVDFAQALAPVENLAQALTVMTDFVADALNPRHDGISVKPIPSVSVPGSGYLVIDAPRSSRRPHMNQFEKTYHKRAGASKFRMEHYDVEDAFRRQTGPELVLEYDLQVDTSITTNPHKYPVVCTVACVNKGVGSARDIAITYELQGGLRDTHMYYTQPAGNRSEYKGSFTCAFPPDLVVHPGATRALRSFFVVVTSSRPGQYDLHWDAQQHAVEITINTSAEGMRPVETVLRLTRSDIEEALQQAGVI